ncbi:MAG: ABC transporter ATP-binding protein [Pseudomonadota bacterium]|nr:ABC transporter ATP-binding protein [Pseudomonadota bacterium]
MSADILIDVQHLYRYYGEVCAVNDVSFSVRRGEVLGLLGPNGAGKTSTMQMISGTLAPSAGAITVGGIDILESPKAAKANLGYLPEHPPLYRDMRVDEYLFYCARLHRIHRHQCGAVLAKIKSRCGLGDAGRRLIGNLSKGYQQRVGIAQAILHAPAVVILDEPTVGLDPIQIREIRDLIGELRGDHSVILSTHILPEVQAVCDRVLIIHQGRLVLDDSVERLTRRQPVTGLRIALRQPPDVAQLQAIAGVDQVERLDSNRFVLRHPPDRNPADGVVDLAVQRRWGLFELVPETRSLEETFVQLTAGERLAGGEQPLEEAFP